MKTTLTEEDRKRLKFYYLEKTDPKTCGVSIKYATDHRYFPFAFIVDYKITKIRAFEFAKSIGVSFGAVQGWIRRGLIESEKINNCRWLDIDSVIDFIENNGRITIAQEELFMERLMFVYASLAKEMQQGLEKALSSYTTIL